jgi:hypothetical protein
MTPERLRQIIATIGRSRGNLARLLGYASEASLRQAERGRARLPDDKASWLERYAAWLKNNPPPTKNSP